VFVAYPSMGDLAAAKAFAIVILGGLGSIPGATIGGFILALVEELGAGIAELVAAAAQGVKIEVVAGFAVEGVTLGNPAAQDPLLVPDVADAGEGCPS
jgi:branched-subunit amino acid ABC-type transport system permease component